MKLLAIDDDKLVLLSLSAALGALGHECSAHHNWEDARDELERSTFDAVLTDQNMAGTNGFEVLKFIREMEDGSAVKVIAITGDPDKSMRQSFTEAGFDGHLRKPYTLDELADLLGTLT